MILISTGLILAHAASGTPVNLASLLREMTDLTRLTRRPSPSFKAAQSSSYDRNSKTAGNEAWFANGDAGKFLREEPKNGRIEFVMADLKGPGAVVRIWSANPAGTLRLYFDGESEARFTWKMAEVLGGKIPEFPKALSYFSSRGANLYFPIPYAKSLKITADNSDGDGVRGLYYHVGHRSYAPTTPVTSLTADELSSQKAPIQNTASKLAKLDEPEAPANARVVRQKLEPLWFEAPVFESEGGSGAIYSLQIRVRNPEAAAVADLPWDHPKQLHIALRKLKLVAEFDGKLCVDVPVADFFCSAGGARAFISQPIEVSEDGWMKCRFVMPYAKSARIRLVQQGGPLLNVETEVLAGAYRFGPDSYHFRAQWLTDRLHTRPMRDMTFLDAAGEGVLVGVGLHVANPTGAWWGEGDEKVFVDGEAFPSTFGTGTEDYFGYAWCDPTPFTRAYHAQPRCDGPGNRGHTNNVRWQTFDAIPYRSSLQFLIELWHWAEVTVDYDRVAYWYAPPQTAPTLPAEPSRLDLTYIPGPEPVRGATEGETAPILEKTGGTTELQEFGELSRGKQLWWRDAKEGDRLRLDFSIAEDGEYEVSGNFCFARDYGRHRLTLGDAVLQGAIDFYSAALEWRVVKLGVVRLKKGKVAFGVESLGHRAEAIPRNMFGLDYLIFRRIGP